MALALTLGLGLAPTISADVISDVTPVASVPAAIIENAADLPVALDTAMYFEQSYESYFAAATTSIYAESTVTSTPAESTAIASNVYDGPARAPSQTTVSNAANVHTAPANQEGWTTRSASDIVAGLNASAIAANANISGFDVYNATLARCEDRRAANEQELANSTTTA